jgi:hypothetical protein
MAETTKVTDEKFNPSGNASVHILKTAALEYQRLILINTPAGPEQDVALQHLKTCSMWAVSSLFPTGPTT